jgi:hypothetical protein
MNLFKYTPSPYISTQVDLPLDFIYKQLETQQKEFDAETALVNKTTENLLNLDFGLLTEDAQKRVMQNYLPRIEKIRDDLFNTGNVAMAVPALSKFTTDLAGDPEVKNMLKDAKLTETYRQALQQGLYTDKDLPFIFGENGKIRPQLGPGETVQASWYAPLTYVDPVKKLGDEARVMVEEWWSSLPANQKVDKFGNIITTESQIKEKKAEWIEEYLMGRRLAWQSDPTSQAAIYRMTGYKPQLFDEDFYKKNIVDPLKEALSYVRRTDQTSITKNQIPSPIDPKPTPDPDKTKVQITVHPNTTNVSTQNSGIPAWNTAQYPEGITSLFEFESDLEKNNEDLGLAYDAVWNLSGGEIDEDKGIPAASDWINENYINENGFWKVKPGSSAPPVNKSVSDALNNFTNARYSLRNRQSLFEELKEATDVKSYNPNIIIEAKKKVLDKIEGTYTSYLQLTGQDDLLKQYESLSVDKKLEKVSLLPANNKRINEEMTLALKGTPEGKIYQAFENYKNRISQMTLMGLKDDDKVNSMEGQLINNVLGGHISARSLLTGEKLDKGDLDETFTEYIPYKEGDPSKGVDYSQVQTSIGLHPKYGVVGVMSMNGKSFTIDLKDANIDQIFTDENPHYKQQIQVFQQVADSFKRSGTNEGSFKIGNTQFVFEVESENIGGDNPQFYYSEKFDGTNTQSHENLGTIFTRAYEIADNNNKAFDILLQVKKEELLQQYNDEFNRLGLYDTDGATKLKKKYEQKLLDLEEQLKTEFSAPKVVGGSSSGKATPQPGGPLGLGR